MVSPACPYCKILVVEAANNSLAALATAENTAARLGAEVISNSYGARESGFEQPYAQAYDHPGHAIVVSSGDSGFTNGDRDSVQGPEVAPALEQCLVGIGRAQGVIGVDLNERLQIGDLASPFEAGPSQLGHSDLPVSYGLTRLADAAAQHVRRIAAALLHRIGLRCGWLNVVTGPTPGATNAATRSLTRSALSIRACAS